MQKVVSGWGVDGVTLLQKGFPVNIGTSAGAPCSSAAGRRTWENKAVFLLVLYPSSNSQEHHDNNDAMESG